MRAYYETLGIKPDASQQEIKRAYRDKARQCHPDKGGKHQDMAELSHAYSVLSDPESRLLYDQTGFDKLKPEDERLRNLLRTVFTHALNENASEILLYAREAVNEIRRGFGEQIKQLEKECSDLQSRRELIVTKDGEENVFHQIIDEQLNDKQQRLVLIKKDVAVCLKAKRKLRSYTSKDEFHQEGYEWDVLKDF